LTLSDAVLLAMRFNTNVQSEDLQRLIDRMTLATAEWGYGIQYSLTATVSYNRPVSAGVPTYSENDSIVPGATLLTPIGTQLSVQMTNPVTNGTGTGRSYNPSVTFSLTQPLLRGAGPSIALAPLYQARNNETINKLTYKNNLMTTVTAVVNAWLSYILAENSLKAQKISLKSSIKTLEQQEAFLKVGRIAPTDLIQFKASVASQRLSLSQQEVSLGQQKRALLITLGLNPDMPVEISDEINFPGPSAPPPLGECIKATFANNIPYQQSLINLKNTEISLHVTEDSARWQLNLTAARTQGPGPNPGLIQLTNGRYSDTTYALSLSIPIDDVGLNNTVSQARISLHQQKIALEQNRLQLKSTVINAWNTVISQREQIKQANEAVRLAKNSLDIAETKLRFGKVTPFEVSTLQTNLLTQQLSAINVQISYFDNLATLDQTIGTTLERWKLEFRPDPGISQAMDKADPELPTVPHEMISDIKEIKLTGS